jgi:cysteine-rich repeat protein
MAQGAMCVPAAPATCGNRMLDSGETCDDGNTATGDGCNATCQLEQATPADNCPGTPIIARRGTQWYTGTTIGAADDFNCNATSLGPDRVYDLTTADGGNVVIELVPAPSFDAVFNARSGTCPGTSDNFCVDMNPPGVTEWVTNAVTTAGAHYTVVIDGFGPSAGAYRWRITIM